MWGQGPTLLNVFVLNLAEHERFSAYEYKNTKNSLFTYLLAEKCSCSAMFSRKNMLVIWDL